MMTSSASPSISAGNRETEIASRFNRVGTAILRYGLALILIWVGLLKFQTYEQTAIMPLVAHSPFMSWMLGAFGLPGTSGIIGTIEVIAGILIALRPIAARASALGSLLAVITFLVTLTFLLSTPAMAVYAPGSSFPFLRMIGQFLAKDLVLLGAAFYTAGDAWLASRAPANIDVVSPSAKS